jgi:hypothetical protein
LPSKSNGKVASHPDPFEETKFISLFVSPRISSEIKYRVPTSLEPKPCPSVHPNIVLDNGQDSTLIFMMYLSRK